MTKMTAPGGWEVEQITLDGVPTLRVKQHGLLAGTGRHGGYATDIRTVARIMGDAFLHLTATGATTR